MNQLDLLAGQEARDEALDQVEAHADVDWMEAARTALVDTARRLGLLTADDVADTLANMYPDVTTHEPRAMGAVFRWGKSRDLIEPTDQFRPTSRPQGHAGPRRVWRSL